MEGIWEKRGAAAYPVNEGAWRLFNRIPSGTRWVMDSKDPTRRSGDQHRCWFALAHTLFDNQPRYTDFEEFRARLLVYLGYFEKVKTQEGETIAMPKSLKFGNMDADEFGRLVDKTLDFAVEIGFDRAELLAQTREFAGSMAA